MAETENEKILCLSDAIDSEKNHPEHDPPRNDGEQIENELAASLQEERSSALIESIEDLYTGPIPHPETIEAYESVVPGIAEIIIKESFEESRHRRHMENTAFEADIQSRTQGMYLGAGLSALCIVGGCTVAILASPTAGAAIITGNVVALASCFYLGITRNRGNVESTHNDKNQQTQVKADGK